MCNLHLRIKTNNILGFVYIIIEDLKKLNLEGIIWFDYNSPFDRATGLKDITGQMIYENDIVENAIPDYFRIKALVEFKEGYIEPFSKNTLDNWKIIGNIYDTPELIRL